MTTITELARLAEDADPEYFQALEMEYAGVIQRAPAPDPATKRYIAAADPQTILGLLRELEQLKIENNVKAELLNTPLFDDFTEVPARVREIQLLWEWAKIERPNIELTLANQDWAVCFGQRLFRACEELLSLYQPLLARVAELEKSQRTPGTVEVCLGCRRESPVYCGSYSRWNDALSQYDDTPCPIRAQEPKT